MSAERDIPIQVFGGAQVCGHDGQPCYVGLGTNDAHWRCGTSACRRRGPGYKIGHDNREAVRTWFQHHIGCTNYECAKALGLSLMAVGRHVKTLRGEWQPAGDHS